MTHQRIKELLQILWDDVNSAEDLQAFVQKYGHELDTDFLAGIAGVVKDADEAGDENVAGFFRQVGQVLLSVLSPSDDEGGEENEAVSEDAVERAAGLVQKLSEEVNSNEDLARFASEHLHECDDAFFAVLGEVAEAQKAEGNEEIARFFEQTGQMLRQVRQQMASHRGGQAGFSGEKAEIKAENDAINELRMTEPNVAYLRAAVNLERAGQTGNDNLIMYCAFTLAHVAQEFRPYPRLNEAIAAYELAAEKALCIGNEQAYGTTQNNLGAAYSDLPTGDRGENLGNAIACYQNALRVRTENDFPQDYATTQNNLGTAYSDLPTGDRGENLGNAIACYHNALRVYSENDFPQDYAMTQNNLGTAYKNLPTGDRGENLGNAIACYHNALRVYSENDFPQYYAGTQNNLGTAYSDLPTGDRGENLENAIACYLNALRVYSENDFPQYYAGTQNNLGNAYLKLPTGDRGENLGNAIACYENALRVYSENDFPQYYATTQNNLGNAYLKLPTGDRGENLGNAIACYHNALRIYSENDFPQDYAMTQNNLGAAYSDLPTGDRGENLRNAIACYHNALRVYSENDFPQDYAMTQNNLGTAYSDLPTGDRGENLRNAIACYHNALRVYSENDFPQDYAMTQNNLGTAYSDLPTGDRGENLRNAIACYHNALRVYSENDFPQERVDTLYNLALAYDDDFLRDWQKAYDTCAHAIEVLETRVRAVSSAETNRAVAEKQAKIYHRMVSLCIRLGKREEAISFAERGKSRTLVEMLHASRLEPSEDVPKDVRETFLALREKLEQLRQAQESGEHEIPRDFEIRTPSPQDRDTDDFSERRVKFRPVPVTMASPKTETRRLTEEAQKAYDILLEQIRELDPKFAASERVQPISVSEIQEMIPEKTVFVECFTGDDGTYLFVLDGKNDISQNHLVLKDLTAAELFNNLAIKNWLRPYFDYLQNRTPETREAWYNAIETTPALLAEKFWYAEDETGKSLSALVQNTGAERILFLPHSGLHLLPLHLIPARGERRGARGARGESDSPRPSPLAPRLIDIYEIAYAPSVSMLRFTLNREVSPQKKLFAAANPTKDLAFTDTEVRGIKKQFDQSHILWHDKAVKSAVLEHAGKGNAVHFSCHGNFQNASPLDSKLILAHGKADDKNNLTLREIFRNLKLPEAALVTLSACETGMVKLESGDEYIGISSGFLYAGASAVVSSLWAVSDISTSFLMQRLYDNIIAKNMGKAAALREAQQYVRDMTVKEIRPIIETRIERSGNEDEKPAYFMLLGEYDNKPDEERPFAHPYYWGAFTCAGNWG
ncbi:CHAT domain-containing protein [Desulfonema magnum]|nr:CHAT domain-containing protein [Desulfonema magnum]